MCRTWGEINELYSFLCPFFNLKYGKIGIFVSVSDYNLNYRDFDNFSESAGKGALAVPPQRKKDSHVLAQETGFTVPLSVDILQEHIKGCKFPSNRSFFFFFL